MIESISVQELQKLNSINLIDIRGIEKYNNKHIPNAISIPYDKLIVNPCKYLNINTRYYVYCQKGVQSRKICQILKSKGYEVINIIGGYEAWILNE